MLSCFIYHIEIPELDPEYMALYDLELISYNGVSGSLKVLA